MAKQVGIYRRVFPLVSEAFIQEQVAHLTRYEPTFVGCSRAAEMSFPYVAINEDDPFNIKQFLFLMTRSPHCFKVSQRRYLENLDLIHAHFGPDGVYGLALAEHLKIPLVVTFHGYDITIHRTAQALMRTPLYSQFLRFEEELKQKAALFIAVSDFIRQKLIERGYPAHKIVRHVIGVDPTRFCPEPLPASKRYILSVGRHTEKKGTATLIKAFARIAAKFPEVTLTQVGTGKLTQQLTRLTQDLGITQQVNFLGSQPHAKVRSLMQGAEVFALASQTAADGDCEGLPIVLNEASACGIPIVATWHSGIPEAVKDRETGFLVPEQDEVTLADRLEMLLGNPAQAQLMGLRGRIWIETFFDIRKQSQALERHYDALV